MVSQSDESVVQVDTGTGVLEGTLLSPGILNTDTVALIIAGSGPTDRDGNFQGGTNNSLKQMADALCENGMASLRYDKRGIGKSAIENIDESDLRFKTYIDDAQAWLDYLLNIKNVKDVAVLGHSEGSLIGSVVAQHPSVVKFVALAGPGRRIDEILRAQLKEQSADVSELAAPILDAFSNGETVADVPEPLSSLFRPSVQPYMISWLQYDPVVEIAKVNKPVLIIQGNADIQVNVSDAQMLANANAQATLSVIETMNHIFKTVHGDRQSNIDTYNNPSLALHPDLTQTLIDFLIP